MAYAPKKERRANYRCAGTHAVLFSYDSFSHVSFSLCRVACGTTDFFASSFTAPPGNKREDCMFSCSKS